MTLTVAPKNNNSLVCSLGPTFPLNSKIQYMYYLFQVSAFRCCFPSTLLVVIALNINVLIN